MRFARAQATSRRRRVALAVLVSAVLASCGGKGGSGASSARTTIPARVTAARRALCHDLVQIGGGAFRAPNLQRLLPKLEADQNHLSRAGDSRTAASVRKLEAAVRKLISALKGNGNLDAANQGMLRSLSSIPSC